MALYNILIVTDDIGDSSPVNLKNALTALGHTITVVNKNYSGTIDSFDIIFTSRLSGYSLSDTLLANAVNAGIPLILDGTRDGSPDSFGVLGSSILGYIGLAKNIYADSGFTIVTFNTKVSEYDNLEKHSNKAVQIHVNQSSYSWPVRNPNSDLGPNGIILANNNKDLPAIVYYPSGTTTATGLKLNANIIYMSFIYTSSSFTSAFNAMITDFIEFALIKRVYKVEGYIKDEQNNPLSRMIGAYSYENGKMLGHDISDNNGKYVIEFGQNEKVLLICYGENYKKSSILENITPTLIIK